MAKTSDSFRKLKFSEKPPSATGSWIECDTCKTPFYVHRSRLKQVEKKGNVIRYCSLKCRTYRKEFNPFWRKHHTEEAIEKMREHPNRPRFVSGPTNPNVAQYGPDFRGKTAVWWRQYLKNTIGCCEKCGYEEYPGILMIHHIDRNHRRNNRQNLQLLCPNCHMLEHFLAQDGPFGKDRSPGPNHGKRRS